VSSTLHTSRPLTAPDEVANLVDWAVDRVAAAEGKLLAVDLTFETAGESDTPVGDSIAATSTAPVGVHHADEELTLPDPALSVPA
jgi:hypothetical protein